ncbi:DUF5994 family protein [Streptomyces sp. NPDC087425]|uniref:DUF5994 family protein n=1 Tax=Streptomyces sp. NPDC087425 TaxID=3365787 RepID=UPI003829D54C
MSLLSRTPLSAPPPVRSTSGARLRLVAQSVQGRTPRRIDGAWWPRSLDLTAELPGLLGELPPAWGQIAGVLVDEAVWSPFPGRLLVTHQVVRLRRTTAQRSPSTVCLLAPGRGRWDLLVVPPDATEATAARLMAQVDGADTLARDAAGWEVGVR